MKIIPTEGLLLISAAVSAVSFTVTTTSMFELVREKVSALHKKLDELIHCPWCLSHWVCAAVLPFARVDVTGQPPVDVVITLFATVCASGLMHFVLLRAYKPVLEAQLIREFKKKQKEQ